jgi:hypothetical protein
MHGARPHAAQVPCIAAGLVHDTHSGRERVWPLQSKRIEEARHYFDDISARWDHALARLRHFMEDE